jgi:N utilization substance protein B
MSSKPNPHINAAKNAERSRQAAQRAARRFTMQGLYEWQLTGNPAHEIEARTRAENAMHKVDIGYYHTLLAQIIAQHEILDELITSVLDRGFDALDGVERAILRVGAFELRDRIEVPYKVVLNDAIDLSKQFGATDSYKYINGVLDKLARRLRPAEAGQPQDSDWHAPAVDDALIDEPAKDQ